MKNTLVCLKRVDRSRSHCPEPYLPQFYLRKILSILLIDLTSNCTMGNSGSQVDMSSPEASYIQQEVSSQCVVIFSKTYCSYCRASKQLFKNLGVDVKTIELDNRQDCDRLQDVLGAMTGARSVPRVFVNGKCIGGNSELQSIAQSGQLQELLSQCKRY